MIDSMKTQAMMYRGRSPESGDDTIVEKNARAGVLCVVRGGLSIGTQIERRFGRIENGRFFGFDVDDSDNQGGTLRQLRTVGTFTNGAMTCTIPLEVEPAAANVRNVGRRTMPLFGLGLMDAMPDAVFAQVQQTQAAAVRGIARSVQVVLPETRCNRIGLSDRRGGEKMAAR